MRWRADQGCPEGTVPRILVALLSSCKRAEGCSCQHAERLLFVNWPCPNPAWPLIPIRSWLGRCICCKPPLLHFA